MTFYSCKVRCLLGLLSALSVTSKEDSCIVRISKGKMQRFGNCQHFDEKSVFEDIRKRAQEKPSTATTTPEMTTLVTTEKTTADIQTTQMAETRPGPVYDACKTSSSGGCFWTVIIEKNKTNFTRANETCAFYGSVLAVIPDQNTYDEITSDVGKKLKIEGYYIINCWLGMTYNVTTGEIHPPGAYNETWSGEFRNFNASNTNLVVRISRNRSPTEGLFNGNKSKVYGCAICWKPKI